MMICSVKADGRSLRLMGRCRARWVARLGRGELFIGSERDAQRRSEDVLPRRIHRFVVNERRFLVGLNRAIDYIGRRRCRREGDPGRRALWRCWAGCGRAAVLKSVNEPNSVAFATALQKVNAWCTRLGLAPTTS